MTTPWFDAHLDLASLAVCGRDLTAPTGRCGGPHPPAALTFPSLAEGNVRACLGTIFTEADGTEFQEISYPAGDAEAAHRAGVRQLDCYRDWAESGILETGTFGLGRPGAPSRHASLTLGILIECADPVRTPEELPWWVDRGVVAVGLAWWKTSRYAGGNRSDLGLTDAGRALVRAMDSLGVVHDASHLSDRALDDLLTLTDRPVMASHSNCRALLDGRNQRHLTDGAIREIARRGGVIGLNLYSRFLREGLAEDGRCTIGDCVAHVERVCELAGHRRAVGMGSDLDGGFSAARLPAGIDRPRDYARLAEALAERGWSAADLDGFRWENWGRFWKLPPPHGA